MAVKKIKFPPENSDNVNLIGIKGDLNDYRLAYFLNKILFVDLQRLDNLPIYNDKSKSMRYLSFYSYYDSDQRVFFYLISNDSNNEKIVPEYPQADFFLILVGKIKQENFKNIQSQIRTIPTVTFVFVPDTSRIKDLNGIMQDIELHELEQVSQNKQA